jgi:hypothetical protein
MTGIGIRVYSGSHVFYTIIKYDGSSFEYLNISNIRVPEALTHPESLSYVRSTLLDIMAEYQVETAVIRVQESVYNITQNSFPRFYLEGVILECLAASNVDSYRMGKIATISSLLGFDSSKFKDYSENGVVFDFFPKGLNWSDLSKEEKESVLACHASFNLR